MAEMLTSHSRLKLGSLFDGIGGFPLVATWHGITPAWASEIVPACVNITKRHFPQMKHLGDITKINGDEIEPVDIITFGSPCQDLSVAGKRAGLAGERSGLFGEAIRIIDEMLISTNREYPKYLVFENVPGLLSSNNGGDFAVVMDAFNDLGFIADPNILDAQYMGVPQRRRRVFIPCVNVDFLLAKRTSLSESITLQLLTEILLTNLAGLLNLYAGGPIKSGLKNDRCAGGLKKRIRLFSLQKAENLLRLQGYLSEMSTKHQTELENLVSRHGNDPRVGFSVTKEGTQSSLFDTKEDQSMSIELSLKECLDEALTTWSECTTSTLTSETIIQKIYMCAQRLESISVLTTASIKYWAKIQPASVKYWQWAQSVLTEQEECIKNARQKRRQGAAQVGRDDFLGDIERRLSARRIFLVADFRGERAGEVLFKPEGLRGNFKASGAAGEEAAGGVGGGAKDANYELVYPEIARTLAARYDSSPCVDRGQNFVCIAGELYENHAADSRVTEPVEVCPTVTQRWGTGGGNTPLVCAGFNGWRSCTATIEYSEDKAPCIQATMPPDVICAGGTHANAAIDVDLSPTLTAANDLSYIVHSVHQNQCGEVRLGEIANTLSTNSNASGRNAPLIFACRTDQTGSNGLGISEGVGYTLDSANGQAVVSLDCRNLVGNEELSATLQAKSGGGYSLNYINPVLQKQIIRRLTPTECERLQGFPDGWTSLGQDDKPISDAARYRALGNSVALPCVDYVLGGIAEVLAWSTQ